MIFDILCKVYQEETIIEFRTIKMDWDVYDEMYTYDANGNPTSITRGYGTTPMQDITFGYSGNQIISIGNAGYDELLGKVPQIPTGEYISACSYDANGNMTRDDSREIASITYNPINLPALTRFADIKNSTGKVTETNAIYTDYRADGFKTSRLNRTIYITTATKVNSKGETIVYDKSTGVDNQRYYYGNLMKENGKVKHIYNEAGYVDIDEAAGTNRYNFYVRDYLGSVKAVVGANGELWQFTDYHVTGIPSSQFGALNADDRLHTGKEYNAFNGLHMYDNNARSQDPILGRFTTPDPLAEAYPNFSPYAHCVNNPLKHIDPDGRHPLAILAKAFFGATVDLSAQVSTSMANGMGFFQALANADYTSVGASFVTSAIAWPGASTAAKTVMIGTIATDAAIDIDGKGKIKTIVGTGEDEHKTLTEAGIDIASGVLPGATVNSVTSSANKAITSDLTAKSAATLTKETKSSLTQAQKTINNQKVQTAANGTADFVGGVGSNTVKEDIKKPNK